MPAKPNSVEELTREIRACFARLRAVGDALHADFGLTAAQRAVVEFLFENGDHTVPQIARAKRVTRQHIQTLVDSLVVEAMVVLRDNPRHKRSPLVRLTDSGQRAFEAARRREAALLEDIAARLTQGSMETTLATLGQFRSALEDHLQPEEDDD